MWGMTIQPWVIKTGWAVNENNYYTISTCKWNIQAVSSQASPGKCTHYQIIVAFGSISARAHTSQRLSSLLPRERQLSRAVWLHWWCRVKTDLAVSVLVCTPTVLSLSGHSNEPASSFSFSSHTEILCPSLCSWIFDSFFLQSWSQLLHYTHAKTNSAAELPWCIQISINFLMLANKLLARVYHSLLWLYLAHQATDLSLLDFQVQMGKSSTGKSKGRSWVKHRLYASEHFQL